MPYIIFFFKIRMIFSLVAMTGLEKCCITSAYLQWLCDSGERPMALLFDDVYAIGAKDQQRTYFMMYICDRAKKSVKDLFDDVYAVGANDQQRIYLIMFMR